jgi:hypothetical protein
MQQDNKDIMKKMAIVSTNILLYSIVSMRNISTVNANDKLSNILEINKDRQPWIQNHEKDFDMQSKLVLGTLLFSSFCSANAIKDICMNNTPGFGNACIAHVTSAGAQRLFKIRYEYVERIAKDNGCNLQDLRER